MKDVKYYKEGAHNYLVLVCDDNDKKSYQQKMLERQNLPHIFSCKIKYINGEAFYYYDITSKVNMQNLYRGKAWDLTMIKKVLSDYETALAELDSFLLEQNKLILEPEYIYYDYGSDNYIFLFYPDFGAKDNIYEALFDFWVEHLDNQDSATVECIYKMYEEAEACCLGIGRIKELLERYETPSAVQERENISGREVMAESGIDRTDQYVPSDKRAPANALAMAEQERNPGGFGTAFYRIFLVLVILGELAVGIVYMMFQCTEKEKLILLAAAVVMACLLILDCRLLIREHGLQKRKEEYDHALVDFWENDYENVTRPMPEKVQMKEFLSVGNGKNFHDADQRRDSENDSTGETVFFSSDAAFENKLYALDRKNKKHISLEALPVTVGKLKGAVDIYLDDSSVSRMHAQIETDGKAYYIKDLNSTNGTFLNGLRLNPNARMEIEPGDEIKFGKLKYSFR